MTQTQIFQHQLAQLDEETRNTYRAFHTSVPCWIPDRNMVVLKIMTTLTPSERYREGYDAYLPDPYDIVEYPDNLSFYRAWNGVARALGAEDYSGIPEKHRGLFHTPICWVMRMPVEQQWLKIVEILRGEIDRWQPPEMSSVCNWGFYELEKKDLALSILRDQHKANVEAWQARKQAAEERQRKYRQEWMDKFHSQALFEDFVRGLIG